MQNVMDMWFIKDNNDNSYGFKPREEKIYA